MARKRDTSDTADGKSTVGGVLVALACLALSAILVFAGAQSVGDFGNQPQVISYADFVARGSDSERLILSEFYADTRLAVRGYWTEERGRRRADEYLSGYFVPLLRSEHDAGPVRALVLIPDSRVNHGRRPPSFEMQAMGYEGPHGLGEVIRGKVSFKGERDEIGQSFRDLRPRNRDGEPVTLSVSYVVLTTADAGPGASLLLGIVIFVLAAVALAMGVLIGAVAILSSRPIRAT